MHDDVEHVWWAERPIPVWRIFGIKADTLVTFLYCLSALLGVVGIVAGCFLQAPYSAY
ncbi:hypothetical protein [Rhizobium sp. MHM7A]|uniref:hypothetical protein n=1 Tax=Rhizobium sp. MHM7A TaxID=2583233 RepID=UPI00148690FC|nr:hypothetical protein [Rhizobium sp. MHM7A]